MATKFVFVTGGVVSSIGKGIVAASLGRLLKSRGLSVVNQKLDPYINIDPGTMSPYQHGEVFVTDDGAETDLDLGHYERFVDVSLSKSHSVTAGSIYAAVLDKERKGDYLGATVQVIPHITRQIKDAIMSASTVATDVVISEIGGTVGDIEGLPFLEAVRQFRREVGKDNCIFIHVTLVPYIKAAGEAKTKPTQHSVKELRSIGIQPDIIVCRCDRPLSVEMKDKISLFCDIAKDCVILNSDAETLYEVPLLLGAEGLDTRVCQLLHLDTAACDLSEWRAMVAAEKNPLDTVKIALVGKYVKLHDAYLSVAESLAHGGIANHLKVEIKWIDAETVNAHNIAELLSDVHGLIVPGGFGSRGLEGKILALQYARTHLVPAFGICLGMQMMVVEYARNVLKWSAAHSREIDAATPYPVIDLMEDQVTVVNKGGTMRLGKYLCDLQPHTISQQAYGQEQIWERHRHRYEFNNAFTADFVDAGMVVAGRNPGGNLVEIVEVADHPWYVGVQFHPEFKSRPNKAHPLFREFIKAAGIYKRQ